jgi:hypothetical protein
MSDPHNPARYGEVWPQHKIDACLAALQPLKTLVVLSGGWAWHFMSPPDHVENKHGHDHKDIDLMVPPRTVSSTMIALREAGFEKVATKYDRLQSAEDFRRYEKVVDDGTHQPFRITIDFFVKDVPVLQCPGGWLVVRPDVLLGYYSRIHSSTSCWAVLAAQKLLAAGLPPEALIGDKRLLEASAP